MSLVKLCESRVNLLTLKLCIRKWALELHTFAFHLVPSIFYTELHFLVSWYYLKILYICVVVEGKLCIERKRTNIGSFYYFLSLFNLSFDAMAVLYENIFFWRLELHIFSHFVICNCVYILISSTNIVWELCPSVLFLLELRRHEWNLWIFSVLKILKWQNYSPSCTHSLLQNTVYHLKIMYFDPNDCIHCPKFGPTNYLFSTFFTHVFFFHIFL